LSEMRRLSGHAH